MAEILPYYIWKHVMKLLQSYLYSSEVEMQDQGTKVRLWNEYTHIYTYTYICVYVGVCIHTHMYTYINIYVYVYIYM